MKTFQYVYRSGKKDDDVSYVMVIAESLESSARGFGKYYKENVDRTATDREVDTIIKAANVLPFPTIIWEDENEAKTSKPVAVQ